jgi:hypothetical protein
MGVSECTDKLGVELKEYALPLSNLDFACQFDPSKTELVLNALLPILHLKTLGRSEGGGILAKPLQDGEKRQK